MQSLKREVKFIDANKHLVVLDVGITTRNGYPEFTISGTCNGNYGQCDEQIKPATEDQKELLKLWDKYHLKNISKITNFKDHLLGVCDRLDFEYKAYRKNQEAVNQSLTPDEILLNQMQEFGIDEDKLDACRAYLNGMDVDDLADFEESYFGQYGSDIEFAKQEAENYGLLDDDIQWPHNCIDWERAARSLMNDYEQKDGHYFRIL